MASLAYSSLNRFANAIHYNRPEGEITLRARTEDRSAVPVEAHGETIQVASELGKGTTFTVRLPG
jgi:signal transduction histidine kinase